MPKLFKNQSIGLVLVASSSISFLCSSCSNLRDDGEKALALAMQAYEEYDLPATLPKIRSIVRVKDPRSNRTAYVSEGVDPLLGIPVTVGRDSAQT